MKFEVTPGGGGRAGVVNGSGNSISSRSDVLAKAFQGTSEGIPLEFSLRTTVCGVEIEDMG